MKEAIKKPFALAYFIGLGFNLASLLVYLLMHVPADSFDLFSTVFFVNYGMAFVYLIFLLGQKLAYKSPRPNVSYGCWINVVVLFTISAFSLNKEMSVFAKFPGWLNMFLLTMVALFFVFPFISKLPSYLKAAVYFLSGITFVFALYMSIYLLPLIPVSVAGLLFFGISVHTFVPSFWTYLSIHFLLKKREASRLKHFFWAGLSVPLFVLGFYLYKWNGIQTQAKDILSKKNLQLSNQLPDVIQLAQKLPSDPLAEEILMSPHRSQRFWEDGLWINTSGEGKFHDPLSVIASVFFDDLDIGEQTVETLLNIRRDYRHKTTRKLWTGTSLATSSVSTNIQVFPQYRLAYHEKTIVIHNDENKKDRNVWFTSNTQEALYTFHVPEGSIVTSLSLWINGREQKSRLSTTQKADSAYQAIVGVERRDPAIVHWQEGNRVTVNVFPCTSNEDRTFKIGVTTPLFFKEGNLRLENIWFEGPGFNSAREATKISFGANVIPLIKSVPEAFERDVQGNFVFNGSYTPSWVLEMEAVPLAKNKFSFNGFDYYMRELETTQSVLDVQQVFLDVTKEWRRDEYDAIINSCSGKNVYAWLPEKVKITPENKNMVWDEIHDNQFSMPFLFDITSPEKTVVIIKPGATSPLLADMKGSDYADKTIDYLLNSSEKICVLNIGDEWSPYWRSLSELRLVNCAFVNVKKVSDQMNSGKFDFRYEDSASVGLNESHLSIIKQPSALAQPTALSAPDHLLRLFAYNDILRRVGKQYFRKEKFENELFREAEEAYVVSPVTSMIVLESEADYERMGIKKNENTVGNASVSGGGAVPEPHEWVLIVMTFTLVARFIYLKRKKQRGSFF